MTFPFSHTGSVTGPLQDPRKLRDKLVGELEKLDARKIVWTEDEVAFRGGIFRLVFSHNLLVAITSGRVKFTQESGLTHIEYRLRFTEMFIVATALVIGWIGLPMYFSKETLAHEWGFQVLCWIWIFGGNYVFTVFRFKAFIGRVVAGHE